VARNGLKDVQLVQAALAAREGVLTFYSDGKYGSCLAEHRPADIPPGWTRYEVPCVRLRDYLVEPVDFLKMNIEGAEWEVLEDSADSLRKVREMVVEYHHLPGLPRTLHKILGGSYAVGAQLGHSHRHIWGVLADHSPYVGLLSCQLRKSYLIYPSCSNGSPGGCRGVYASRVDTCFES
jgi:hypothetical protein